MALVDNFAKVAGTLLAIVKTRAELIAIELEEEWVRLLSYLLLSLSALFCLALTVFLAVILVIVLCWDSWSYSGDCRHDGLFRFVNRHNLVECPPQFPPETKAA